MTEWIISGNPKRYDVINAFRNLRTIDWTQSVNNELALQMYKEGYDARFQAAQTVPVFINEMMVRLIYSIRRFVGIL